MQEYHKLAGGWTDEGMVDFWRHSVSLDLYGEVNKISRTAKKDFGEKALALYKQKRGNQ